MTTTNLVTRQQTALARPLKTLVPLIKDELQMAYAAGRDHYRMAMRRRLTKAYHDFRDEKYLLLRSYNAAGQIVKVKLFDSNSESDKIHATQELEARQERQMDSREALEAAAQLAQIELQWDSPEDND